MARLKFLLLCLLAIVVAFAHAAEQTAEEKAAMEAKIKEELKNRKPLTKEQREQIRKNSEKARIRNEKNMEIRKNLPKFEGNEKAKKVWNAYQAMGSVTEYRGLAYRVLRKGTGDRRPNDDNTVYVTWQVQNMYRNTILDHGGSEDPFDDQATFNHTVSFKPKDHPLFPWAFSLAVEHMVIGDKFEWAVPSNLGYGYEECTYNGPLVEYEPVKAGDLVFLTIDLKDFDGEGDDIFSCIPGRPATCDEYELGWINLYSTMETNELYSHMEMLEWKFEQKGFFKTRQHLAQQLNIIQQLDPAFDDIDVRGWYREHLEVHREAERKVKAENARKAKLEAAGMI
mmetsp:Transcript_41563/g.50403  ORF Transcript_41563/g.50403 Transcript_41563/m.50403 type:complete len:340 (+) Transcript_41563:127-1146(+)|eukprot:CAMPEP_0197856194 /NCGR_PEP_ID=MMETSP1438-20131217/28072_1 /TAXON_ID=1461541 /ORGANISM="Pterosperma sp., Strain CCMP1384" /LENGTH=339 /DNA_ID=CAMNT_0043471569 /DNA_START=127 /DNA_END=1146 /DNA_ORIENTATION=+